MSRRLVVCLAWSLCIPVTLSHAQTESDSTNSGRFIGLWLNRFDKNEDGRLGRAEVSGRLKENFNRIDADNDNFLDPEELTKIFAGQTRKNGQNRRSEFMTQRLLASAPKDVAIEPDIAYREGDSKAWRLDLVRPKVENDKPRPAIVFIHGGGWRGGDKRRGYFMAGAIEYAQKGYVCITVNYRLTGEAPFPACVEDVKCAVRWLRANAKKYKIDPNRVGGYGNSAGAHLVAMLGLAGPDAKLEGDGPYLGYSSLLQAVCCSATPTDMSKYSRVFNGVDDSQKEALMKNVSPISHVSANAPPFLVVHGTADGTVNIKHGDTFVEALEKAGAKSVEYIRIEGAGHGVFGQHSKRTHPAMEKFFATHLKKE